ncbi:polyphenol oxidase, chloroplastic-like [Salvia hispanica]|uniref:polyphenol oxidase, chloroplastic-like n=1 Tax=Salvia hispanica TaxID=49212 RepID=UPI002009C2B1|nr:polyphenol oxidase, chloroplastic-like [Salvia hispanica]
MQQEMMVQPDSALAFMGQPYRAGDPPPGGASGGTSKRGSHAGIHVWTGNPDNPLNENMGNFYSAARDPIFYCHHTNVDRMWTVWEDLPADYPKTIDDPDFLDAAFMFYDEKKNLVRTAAQAFPASLAETIRVVVPKPAKGKADEVLLIQGIVTDNSKLISFDIYVNDDENSTDEAVSAERAGSFTQVPHRSRSAETPSDLRIILTELYKNINIADDDDIIVVTIVPRSNGDAVTIGGVKIETRVPAA